MTVYLDVIWLLNYIFDAFLLLLTAMILKRKMKKWRLFIAAFLASSIVLFYFTSLSSVISHPIVKLFYSIFIVLVAFGFHKFRVFIQNLFTFYIITFMVGGGILGLHYFFQTDVLVEKGIIATKSSGLGDPISWLTVIIGFPIVWFLSKHHHVEMEVQTIHNEQLVPIQIKFASHEKEIQLTGLIDSGNQLYDPITKTPVMILQLDKVSSVIPASIRQQCQTPETLQLNAIESEWVKKIRIIPYRSVGQNDQLLLALKPEYVVVYGREEPIIVKKIFIGLSPVVLSSNGEYDCILHPKMLLTNKYKFA